MNAIRNLTLGTILLVSCCLSHAITNTVIAVSGTNIVLSWPSYGYETYLIQYRQTLSATDSWSQLANDYYANSTNMTTYTLYGLASPSISGGGSGDGGSGGGSPPSPDMAMSRTENAGIPMAIPTNGSGSAVPPINLSTRF